MAMPHLPAEVVNNMVGFGVDVHGVSLWWPLRGISRTFQSSIDDRTAGQPTRAFFPLDRHTRALFKNLLPAHIAHRAILAWDDLNGEHDFLPWIIKFSVDWLRSSNAIRADQEYEAALILSKQLAFACKSSFEIATQKFTGRVFSRLWPWATNYHSHVAVHDLAVAAALGLLDLFKLVAGAHVNQSLWEASYLYGYPLAAAAGGDHKEVAEYLLENFEMRYRLHPDEEYAAAFKKAIEESLSRRHSAMTLRLLNVYHKHFDPLPAGLRAKWLETASEDPDGRIYEMVCTLRTEADVREHIASFKRVCKNNNIPGLTRLFVQGHLDVNQGYPDKKLPLRCLLYTAIEIGKPGPVKKLLELGAHPDGLPTSLPDHSPLWLTVERNDLEMFGLLLSWGADMTRIRSLFSSSDDEFQLEREAICTHAVDFEVFLADQWNAFMDGRLEL
ncbi:hypothetical protein J4E86_001551 [Alternaria arbusti]|uniref:uncharacterized protein n=1 Tax=Alternaria arbusti TaxID=232088 RepID=UPI00221FED1A|nr:uncharacterized protein J4E86_001551 [Alternaria arbusti]KAI4959933.1 hypothetical protein J4E86_001551 [Alternaria arbusti]